MTNATLKRRFSLSQASSATVSRLLKACIEKGLIRVANPEVGLRLRRYVPFWVA